jgi:hypothetical protein
MLCGHRFTAVMTRGPGTDCTRARVVELKGCLNHVNGAERKFCDATSHSLGVS